MIGIGLILVMVSASLADSASLLPTIVIGVIGVGLMYAGYAKESK